MFSSNTSSLFGNRSGNTGGGGLFGGGGGNSGMGSGMGSNSGGGGLFGGNNSNQGGGSGLFGSNNNRSGGGGLFGGGGGMGNNNMNSGGGGGLFGGGNSGMQNQGGGGLFGGNSSGGMGMGSGMNQNKGLFGSSGGGMGSNTGGGGLFGGNSSNQGGGGLFGAGGNNQGGGGMLGMLGGGGNQKGSFNFSYNVNQLPKNKENITLVSITNLQNFKGKTLDEIRTEDYFAGKNNQIPDNVKSQLQAQWQRNQQGGGLGGGMNSMGGGGGGGGLFGGGNSGMQNQGGGGLFGGNNSGGMGLGGGMNQNKGGLFGGGGGGGGMGSNTGGGGLFGGGNNQQGGGGGLFGGGNNQQGGGGGLFGNKQGGGGGLFGGNTGGGSGGGGLFGSNQNQQGGGGGGLFGNNQNQQGGGGGGLFGNNQNKQGGGGLFGGNTGGGSGGGGLFGGGNNQQGGGGGGLFGNQNKTGTSGGGGLFGNTGSTGGSGGGGLFGNQNKTGTSGGGGLFGNTGSTGGSGGGGLFGGSSGGGGGLFSGQNKTGTGGGLFGNSGATGTGGGGLFGGSGAGAGAGGAAGGNQAPQELQQLLAQAGVDMQQYQLYEQLNKLRPTAQTNYSLFGKTVSGQNPADLVTKYETGRDSLLSSIVKRNPRIDYNPFDRGYTPRKDYAELSSDLDARVSRNKALASKRKEEPVSLLGRKPRVEHWDQDIPLPPGQREVNKKMMISSYIEDRKSEKKIQDISRVQDEVRLMVYFSQGEEERAFSVEAKTSSTCLNIKTYILNQIYETNFLNFSKYKLLYKNKILSDNQCVGDIGFKDNDKVYLILDPEATEEAPDEINGYIGGKDQFASEDLLPKLTKNYHTEPSIVKLNRMSESELRSIPNFSIYNEYVKLTFDGKTDLTGLDLDEIVVLGHRSVEVYPDPIPLPEAGRGLNKAATIEFYQWSLPKKYLNNVEAYRAKMEDWANSQNAQFLYYDPDREVLCIRVKDFNLKHN